MQTTLLSADAFNATFRAPMRDVQDVATDVIDIWPYVSHVPAVDFSGHEVSEQFVEHVYRSADDLYDHVLVMTYTKNVYLVVVIDLAADSIYGHYLLDLNHEYGLS